MTAAEEPADFQNNFLADESENSIPLLSEEDSDSVVENKIKKMEGTNSVDLSSVDFPGSSRTENSSEELNSGDLNMKEETKKSETEDDEWLDIMGSGDFKKKVCILFTFFSLKIYYFQIASLGCFINQPKS